MVDLALFLDTYRTSAFRHRAVSLRSLPSSLHYRMPVTARAPLVELQKLPEGTLGVRQVLDGFFRFYKTCAAEETGLTPQIPTRPVFSHDAEG